jgi:hypothetical protein
MRSDYSLRCMSCKISRDGAHARCLHAYMHAYIHICAQRVEVSFSESNAKYAHIHIYIYIYMYIYIHTYICAENGSRLLKIKCTVCTHAYIHTNIHAYIHPNIHACIHTNIHAYIHARRELKQAAQNQKKARRTMCCLITVLLRESCVYINAHRYV